MQAAFYSSEERQMVSRDGSLGRCYRMVEGFGRLMSKKLSFEGMSVDEMWQLHEEVSRVLSAKLTAEKRELERRLAQLRRAEDFRPLSDSIKAGPEEAPTERRKYPQVLPRYRNSKEPFEIWSGRGRRPGWLTAALKAGRKLEEFAIDRLAAGKTKSRSSQAQDA
ncbi:H-NS family nucleoid-associated regulatory protein [Bradyrhizobium genosp. P]|uniref:H-NS histone family protein n=1 Tax=Bradyrhizobium genosp. P TaxID=83641 RepID=UPI003CEEE704